jgi:hypothetical protein
MRAPVAIVVAAALALAAPAAAQRPRPPDRPPTSVVPTLTPNRIQIYNDYEVPETTLDAGDVVVHYVTGGINAPPLNDDDGDGIPDFVRRVGDAADNALAYYRARGFVPPAPDTGGPDARPDLYVSRFAPGILGVAFPAPAADGGAFVALANQLDPSIDVSFGSLWGTVAHELFHLVQFSYYGTREPTMPDWVSEGTAAGMESRVFPALADLVNRLQVSAWLRRPTVPLTVATGGAQLLWHFLDVRAPALLPAYLPLLARTDGTHAGTLLAQTYRRVTGGSFAPAFLDFAASLAARWPDTLGTTHAARGALAPFAAAFVPLRGRGVAVRVSPGGGAAVTYRCESPYAGRPARQITVGRRIPSPACPRGWQFADPLLVVANGTPGRALTYRATFSR